MLTPDYERGPRREEQILGFAAQGMTDKQISARLGISVDTVATYWRRVLNKYGASSRTEVVARHTKAVSEEAISELTNLTQCLTVVVDHFIALEREVTERPQDAVRMAEAILMSSPDWILILDAEGDVQFSNRASDANLPGMGASLMALLPREMQIALDEWEGLMDFEFFVNTVRYLVRAQKGVGPLAGFLIISARSQ